MPGLWLGKPLGPTLPVGPQVWTRPKVVGLVGGAGLGGGARPDAHSVVRAPGPSSSCCLVFRPTLSPSPAPEESGIHPESRMLGAPSLQKWVPSGAWQPG